MQVRFELIYRLHRLLRAGRRCAAAELRDDLECSGSALKRAISYMRVRLRAPIVCDPHTRLYRYETSDSTTFELPGLWFGADELVALSTLVHLLDSLEPGLLREHLDTCRARIRSLVKGDVDVDEVAELIRLLPMNRREVEPGVFNAVTSATVRRRQLVFEWRSDGGGAAHKRTVSPHRLVRYRDNWYLDALCHRSGELRSFGLAWMAAPRVCEEPSRTVPAPALDAFYASAYGIYNGPARKTAVVRFDGPAARYAAVEMWHPAQKRALLADGRVELHIPYGEATELVKDILSWGELAEVVRPAGLRQMVGRKLGLAVARYAKKSPARGSHSEPEGG